MFYTVMSTISLMLYIINFGLQLLLQNYMTAAGWFCAILAQLQILIQIYEKHDN